MKFYNYDDNKGHGYESERPERLLTTNSPDEPWNRPEQQPAPGTKDDVWKRYIESRLRTFGSRGN